MKKLPFSFLMVDLKQQNQFKIQNYTIWFIMTGRIEMLGTEQYVLEDNDMVLLNPSDTVAVSLPCDCSVLSCIFENDQFCRDIGIEEGPLCLCRSDVAPDQYDKIVDHLVQTAETYFNHVDTDWTKLMSDYYMLIYNLESCIHSSRANGMQEFTDGSLRMQQLQSYIYLHYKEPLSLSDLACHFHLSSSYLSRYFKNNFGINFNRYLQDVRLENAAQALVRKKDQITDIAYESGFTNLSTFNALFKRKFGLTPREYRNHLNRNSGIRISGSDMAQSISNSNSEFTLSPLAEPISSPNPDALECRHTTERERRESLLCPWRELINLGNAVHCLSREYQSQIAAIQKSLHFKYARIDRIIEMVLDFDSSISINHRIKSPNFNGFDKTINFLLDIGMIPFLELGRRPSKFEITASGYYYRPNIYSDIHEDVWNHLLQKLLSHCVNSWGLSKVSQWMFEIWMQPSNIPAAISLTNYVKMYENTQTTIKTLIPSAKLGGPGMNLGGMSIFETMEALFEQFRSNHVTPDFISAYLYPSCEIERTFEGDLQQFNIKMIMSSDDYTNRKKIKNFKHLVNHYFPQIPIYITEFDTNIGTNSMINENCYKSSSIVKNSLDLCSDVDALGYWQLSDITQEPPENNKLVFGGNGLISRHGIMKCGYYAFEFLSKLYTTVIDRGDNYITTENSADEYSIIVHNYKNLSNDYCTKLFKSSEKLSEDQWLEDIHPLHFIYTIHNCPPGRYIIKESRLNNEHGNLTDSIVELNRYEFAGAEEIEYLSRICVPQKIITCFISDGSLTVDTVLSPLEVVQFIITKFV